MATIEDFKKQRDYIEPLIKNVMVEQKTFRIEHQ